MKLYVGIFKSQSHISQVSTTTVSLWQGHTRIGIKNWPTLQCWTNCRFFINKFRKPPSPPFNFSPPPSTKYFSLNILLLFLLRTSSKNYFLPFPFPFCFTSSDQMCSLEKWFPFSLFLSSADQTSSTTSSTTTRCFPPFPSPFFFLS